MWSVGRRIPSFQLGLLPEKNLVLLVVQKEKPKFWIKGAEMLSRVWEVQPWPGVAALNQSGKAPVLKHVAIFAAYAVYAASFIQQLSSGFLWL